MQEKKIVVFFPGQIYFATALLNWPLINEKPTIIITAIKKFFEVLSERPSMLCCQKKQV